MVASKIGLGIKMAEKTERKSILPGGPETILVVEDDSDVLSLIARIIEPLGYTILKAGDGEEALNLSEDFKKPIDLLITDMMLPGINGRELAAQLIKGRPAIQVVMMSGQSDHSLFRMSESEQNFHILPKPFTRHTLAAKIREALDSHSGGLSE